MPPATDWNWGLDKRQSNGIHQSNICMGISPTTPQDAVRRSIPSANNTAKKKNSGVVLKPLED